MDTPANNSDRASRPPALVLSSPPSWGRSRYGFAVFYGVSLLLAFFALRLLLMIRFRADVSASLGEIARAFAIGFHRDLVVGACATVPLAVWFALLPNHWFGRLWHRVMVITGFGLFWLVQIFLLATEYCFFEEFHSRFNTVAVDYLLYPHEVFINIWEEYPVLPLVAMCAVVSAVWLWVAWRGFRTMWARPFSRAARWLHVAGAAGLALALCGTVTLKGTRFSRERALNEIANNGTLSILAAAWTRHLDYPAFYSTLPQEEAWRRTRRLLAEPGTQFVDGSESIRRRVAGDPHRPPLNVVVHLQESLGSEFWGSLGRPGASCTPEMDRLAATEGLLFTNVYASGNRTVRGIEGVLASFPPLPGDSIVARDLSDHVETLARVLKRDGYNTLFLYGGRGLFDGMRAFALKNGFDRFIEQKDIAKPTFQTIWGVCDEDIMIRSIREFRAMAAQGKPFFGTILSVSNHKPYTYPPGRIDADPNARRRENAVRYADYALGLFFRLARQESFWTNTVFVVVADHGPRVYGSQTIPIKSYEIPLLIVGPSVVSEPRALPQLACSLDVAPTVLGLIGRPYETLFFGRDLLKGDPAAGRVWIQHNRDVGLYARDGLVALGLRQVVEFYTGDPRQAGLRRLTHPGDPELELARDTIALYQVADQLYTQGRYCLSP